MEHQILPGIVAQLVDDAVQLAPVGDAEDQLPPLLLRQTVEFQTEGPLEQPGQPGGKVGALGNEPHLRGAEGIAVEQHAVGLGPQRSTGAAPASGTARFSPFPQMTAYLPHFSTRFLGVRRRESSTRRIFLWAWSRTSSHAKWPGLWRTSPLFHRGHGGE